MKKTIFLIAALALAPAANAAPMKARVIQPLFSLEDGGFADSYRWEVEQLGKCDPSLDLIVLPEFSDVPGKATNDEFYGQLKAEGENYRQLLSETARRCGAIVCAGCVELTPEGPRNTTFVYDRDGNLVGRYLKQHLTRGEWANRGFDRSYTQTWSAPTIVEVDGLRLAFLTCYDFYYYENFSNIGRYKPDIVIGCSNQRSDPHAILDIINTFCAYNTGAYLVRASVSMGESSPVGGCSCIVAPTGEILGNLHSRRAVLDAEFDPAEKYLKPAGYGNPPSLHSEYMEIGRRPMKYRPGGPAVVPFADEAPAQRVAALGGMRLKGRGLMARLGAAVGAGVQELFLPVAPPVRPAAAAEPSGPAASAAPAEPSVRTEAGSAYISQVLAKFGCQTILNLWLAGDWTENDLQQLRGILFDYDVLRHVCITGDSEDFLASVAAVLPDVPRCLLVPARSMPRRSSPDDAVAAAHAAGLRVCTICRQRSVSKFFALGADTAVVANY